MRHHSKSPERLRRYHDLLSGLDRKASSSQLDLHGRLKKCGGPDWGNRFTCRSPACPPCRDRYIARQRREAQKQFDGVPNSELVLVTIVLGASQEIGDIGRIFDKGRRDLRNMINRRRRSSDAWNSLAVVGWLEVDAYDPIDIAVLGSDKITQLSELITDRDATDDPIWVPTIHAIVHAPSLGIVELQSAFSLQWSSYRQSDVRGFHINRSSKKNIGNIVNYANKHECMTGPAGFRSPWPMSWQVSFYAWMHQFSRGFHSVRVSVGAKVSNASAVSYRTVPADRLRPC